MIPRTILIQIFLFFITCVATAFADTKWWEELPRPSWNRFKKVKQSQQWFEVYQVLPAVYAIYEPGQWEEVISYLIVGTEKTILFDTGLGIGDMGKLVSELSAIEPIVINSHTHYDHVGGNYQFPEIHARVTEFSQTNSRGMLPNKAQQFIPEESIWKPLPEGYSHKEFRIRAFQISKPLKDGDSFDLGDRTIEVFFTPGHSPDSLCLIDRKNKILFTGDTFYPAPLYAHRKESSFQDYEKSAILLEGIGDSIDYLMPAHNETLLLPNYLKKMRKAFSSIRTGETPCTPKDDACEYKFEGFSIIAKPSDIMD
jgi:glyoxylase-like metal-dependent hydrolase (beta-lactamase superfamily II)